MGASYPTTLTIEAYLGGAWVDITSYWAGPASFDWGIDGNGPIDFLARTGRLTFPLDNTTGIFSPNGSAPISADWKKGAPVKFTIVALGQTRVWYGKIDDFSFESQPQFRGKLITVYVVDYMDKVAKYPLNYPDIALEQRSDQIVQTIITALPFDPLSQSLATGTNTFPVAFDTVTDFTRARTEIMKVLYSELCHCYVQHGGTLGEKFVLENATTRATPTAKIIPQGETTYIKKAGGGYVLKATDGGKIIQKALEAFAVSDGAALSMETSFGDNVINDIMFRYIPKRYSSAAPAANYSWTSPLQPQPTATEPGGYNILFNIGAGETKIVNFKYGIYNNQVGPSTHEDKYFENVGDNSRLLITPPFPTSFDWLKMYDGGSYEFGSPVDITASLTVNSFEAFFDKFKVSLTNSHATKRGYIEATIGRQTGSSLIVVDPDIPVYLTDSASIAAHDHQPLTFDQVYQIDATDGTAFANQVLADEASPRTTLNRINLCANKSPFWMSAFMNLDVGDYFPAVDTNKGIDGDFFIQDMKFTVDPGGIIYYSLGVKERLPQYSQVTVGNSYSATGNNVGTATIASTVVAATANAAIYVMVAKRGYNDVTSVVRGSGGTAQSFTLYRAAEFADGNYPRYEIWQLLSPNVSTDDIVVTLPGNDYFSAGATVFYGVNQTTPIRGYAQTQGTSQTMSLSITSKPTDIVFDLLSIEKRVFPEAIPTLTCNAGQTQKMNASPDNNWSGATSTKAGTSTTTVGWSNSSALSHNWIYVAISIQGVES